MKKAFPAHLRLATNEGKRIYDSSDSSAPFHGHLGNAKPPATEHLDLERSSIGNLASPHGHRLATAFPSASGECGGQRGVRTAEVVEDVFEGRHVNSSVSMLPRDVKSLTPSPNRRAGKLAYMGKRRVPKDQWAIDRGAAMKAARELLGKSQAEIARLAAVKDRETISQYESGLIEDIDVKTIPRLASALGLPPQRLSRHPWDAKDDGADLRVSSVARQIAYNFDDYPLLVQNQIRETIAKYEALVKQHGKKAVDAMFSPSAAPAPHGLVAMTAEARKRKHSR